MIKNGTQHIASLRDGRQVYLNGKAVGDVTSHAGVPQLHSQLREPV